MKGFILAAGFGTRLRPITYTLPKPMVPLLNRPLIAWAVESFLEAGVNDLIVNLHHLPEVLEDYLTRTYAGRVTFTFSREEEILGTGGGVRRVRPQLENESEFFLVNGDTIQFPRWDELRNAREEHDALAALTLRHPPAGDRFTAVYFDDGRVTGFSSGSGAPMMFAGSHVISRRIFDVLPDTEFSGIVEHAYQPALTAGTERIAGVVDDGLWFDIGTPQRYRAATIALLDATISGVIAPAPGSHIVSGSLIHETASGAMRRSIAGARSIIDGDVIDSVIWDDCRIARGVCVERCIVGHGVTIESGRFSDAVIVADDPAIPAEYERHGDLVVVR